jgi:hypothetical protein
VPVGKNPTLLWALRRGKCGAALVVATESARARVVDLENILSVEMSSVRRKDFGKKEVLRKERKCFKESVKCNAEERLLQLRSWNERDWRRMSLISRTRRGRRVLDILFPWQWAGLMPTRTHEAPHHLSPS